MNKNKWAITLTALFYPIAGLGVIVWLIKEVFMMGYTHFHKGQIF